MPISEQGKHKSEEFINALNNLLNLIDDISKHIPEGKYLELMNQLKQVNDTAENPIINIINVLNNTEVVRENRRRVEMPVLLTHKNFNYKHICPLCDTKVVDIKGHQARDKCRAIRRTKLLSVLSNKVETNQLEKIINKFECINEKQYYISFIKEWKNNI